MSQLKLFKGEGNNDVSNGDPIAEINHLRAKARIKSGDTDPEDIPAVELFNAVPVNEEELAQIIEFRRQFEKALPNKVKPATREERDLED